MSGWYWRVIALKAAFALTCLVSYLRADDNIQKLPFCNPHSNDASTKIDLVIVSTLDGRLTAFATHDGSKAWHLDTKPLLSSNLHHVELTSGGKWVRLVPSLRGTLYTVSGDTIEPLPFDAEQLLSSSYKYSDDLVIAGAHESTWVGVDAGSGGVVYECGAGGCSGEEAAGAGRDLLVLRTHGNTLRALDPRTGAQKWNFSVAEHQLVLSSSRECLGERAEPARAAAIAVALPEGIVAVRNPDSHLTIWQHKLEAPVAGIWRLHGGSLQNIDVLWEATRSLDGSVQSSPPSLYIGVHNTQLYIQESALYAQKLETFISSKVKPWKLQHSRPLIAEDNPDTALSVHDAEANTLSLITLYGNTGQSGNHGFFLYLKDTCDEAVQVPEIDDGPEIISPNDSDNHQHIHVHVYSLWFWWKEVLLIAISSALLMNLMIWPRYFAPKFQRAISPLPINQEYIVVERHYERAPPMNSVEYSGRYENDFTPLRCLGRGGFGVVFEARNNIDHCSYAVKRITLPRKQSKRDRVLREVRALAKLEHEHIVRYFNAWLEEPPPHWQEQRDAIWMRELENASKAVDYTPSTPIKTPIKDESVKLNLQKAIDDCVDALEYDKQLTLPSKRYRSHSCNDSFVIVFDENASKQPDPSTSKVVSNHLTKTSEVTPPNCLSKHLGSGDTVENDEDSFIVFANSHEMSEGLSEARNDSSFNKRLEKVKECDSVVKTDSSQCQKKKKGHTRHWSLDLCVRDNGVTATKEANAAGEAKAASGAGIKMYLYIQMQLCRPDSLHDWLRNNRTVLDRADKVKTLFSQIVSAVEYVHLAGLIHRDLKPSNIFFAPDGKVKVGDFGLVTTMSDSSQDGDSGAEVNVYSGHTHRVGTHLYMSPEQLLGRPYNYKVDIYSLGVILFELLQPFETESERIACLLRLRNAHYPQHFQQKYPHETEVLKLMLSEDPSQRPTASGVKARAPLFQYTDEQWHFQLPTLMAAA